MMTYICYTSIFGALRLVWMYLCSTNLHVLGGLDERLTNFHSTLIRVDWGGCECRQTSVLRVIEKLTTNVYYLKKGILLYYVSFFL
jgi:hypothetical protein